MKNFCDFMYYLAFRTSHKTNLGNLFADIVTVVFLFFSSMLLYYILKIIFVRVIRVNKPRRRVSFVAILFSRKVINLLINIFSAWVFLGLMQIVLRNDVSISYVEILSVKLIKLYIFILILFFASFIISAINEFYEKKFDFSKQYPIYSYLKVVLVFIWFLGLTLIVCYFTNTSPWAFLTGLGAVSAVLLLIFRDTLLGIVASIQVTASNIVRIGDRISIDNAGIDGKVLEIAISTVKIKNADNTIASIPTYTLSSQVVKNWRAMEESGARRIKKIIYIDVTSIRLCDENMLSQLKNNKALGDLISSGIENNLTLYRNYIENYLVNLPEINHAYPVLIHHLEQTLNGLPLEIIAYTNDVTTIGHEKIKSIIFETFLALLGDFALKAYQA